MKIKAYRAQFIATLSELYDTMEAESFFYMILESKHNIKRIDLALQPDLEFSENEILNWNSIKGKLQQEIPIQYILGIAHFYGLEFEVNENVLIPRPETEELVDWIISENLKTQKSNDSVILKSNSLKILDIGTGSGCIAISLAKNLPNATVFAIDISEKAVETAMKNAERNEVNITFLQKNILEVEDLEQQFDIIVSNPPYVRNLEKVTIKMNVLDNEPHLALFVDDRDALLFYRKIADLAQKHLTENGQLYFEINQYLAKDMMDLLESNNFQSIELRKDIYENDRMMRAVFRR